MNDYIAITVQNFYMESNIQVTIHNHTFIASVIFKSEGVTFQHTRLYGYHIIAYVNIFISTFYVTILLHTSFQCASTLHFMFGVFGGLVLQIITKIVLYATVLTIVFSTSIKQINLTSLMDFVFLFTSGLLRSFTPKTPDTTWL